MKVKETSYYISEFFHLTLQQLSKETFLDLINIAI